MKKLLLVVCLVFSMFACEIQQVLAVDYSRISTNAKIVSALDSLYEINRRDVISILNGNNATRKPIRVMFRDLNMFGYGDAEAITARTKNNGLVIYISSEHRGASPECIACLIAHESQHHTFTNTKAEELRAWISETQAWTEFVKRNQDLVASSEPLAKRENTIAKIRTKGGVQGIQKLIATNPVYAGLN
ncbi:MAG: hypothetical protein IJB79_00865 [Candidatus Gastranaerophilales bacterium]|nr:hypothetical protein [Candidatus Gastranaerophilales bacterium]